MLGINYLVISQTTAALPRYILKSPNLLYEEKTVKYVLYDRRDLYGYGIIYITYTEPKPYFSFEYIISILYSLDQRYRSSEQIVVVSTFLWTTARL